jgi:hypothetical protein
VPGAKEFGYLTFERSGQAKAARVAVPASLHRSGATFPGMVRADLDLPNSRKETQMGESRLRRLTRFGYRRLTSAGSSVRGRIPGVRLASNSVSGRLIGSCFKW